jgi:hypothetical protein
MPEEAYCTPPGMRFAHLHILFIHMTQRFPEDIINPKGFSPNVEVMIQAGYLNSGLHCLFPIGFLILGITIDTSKITPLILADYYILWKTVQ